jgi:hypothetical protein
VTDEDLRAGRGSSESDSCIFIAWQHRSTEDPEIEPTTDCRPDVEWARLLLKEVKRALAIVGSGNFGHLFPEILATSLS